MYACLLKVYAGRKLQLTDDKLQNRDHVLWYVCSPGNHLKSHSLDSSMLQSKSQIHTCWLRVANTW